MTTFDLCAGAPLVIVPASFPAAFAPADVPRSGSIDLSEFQRITLPPAPPDSPTPRLPRPRLPRCPRHLRPSPGLR